MNWRPHSLRWRLTLFFTALLGVVLLISFFLVSAANLRIFHAQAAQELQIGEKVFRRLLELNDRQLQQAATVLAADFGFRSAMASGDAATILSALKNQGNRINADLVMLSGLQGHLMAATSMPFVDGTPYPFPELIRKAEQDGFASGTRLVAGKLYELVLVPVRAPLVIGWVTMGVRVDQKMAQELKSLSGLEVTFLLQRGQDWQAAATTLSAEGMGELLSRPQNIGSEQLQLQGLPYQSRLLLIGQSGDAAISALLQRPLQEILAPFYLLQQSMAGLGVLAVLLSLAGSVWLARVVVRPLQALARVAVRIRDGDYAQKIAVPDSAELAQLAGSLSHMQLAIADREQEILALAYRDPLTGLANRAGFVQTVEQQLLPADAEITVLLLDIDRFQQLNDTLGHPAGDQVIRSIGHHLQDLAMSFSAKLARLGGDEFALSCDGDVAATKPLLDGVCAIFGQQLQIDGRVVDVRASIGVAACPVHARTATDLMRCADEAMYVAKRGKSVLSVYDPAKRQFREDHLSLLGELQIAVAQNQLALHLQPKVPLDGSAVREAEALVRWMHPVRGFIPPSDFIPYAEQTGFIRELTRWVIARGCMEAAKLLAAGFPTRLSVNLAARDLLDASLPDYVGRCLVEAGLPVAYLCLEVTESGVMDDPERALQTLHILRRAGLTLAIDDYGTGYSSLAYVKQLPVTELKIDQSFVREIMESAADAMIVHSTVELAHSLGFKVVAEGVETEEINSLLRELGCDYAQGYLHSRPRSAADYLSWLQEREKVARGA